jgi:hypothetical protein
MCEYVPFFSSKITAKEALEAVRQILQALEGVEGENFSKDLRCVSEAECLLLKLEARLEEVS